MASGGSAMNEEEGEGFEDQDHDHPLLIDIECKFQEDFTYSVVDIPESTKREIFLLRPFGLETNDEVGEWNERQDQKYQNHPLLKDQILEKLFEYVRRRDLLACRGVRKRWNELTIPFTRSKFTVSIQLPNRSQERTRRIEDFVAVFTKNRLGIPFAKFKLGQFCTTEGIGQQFLKLCGDTTTEVRLCPDYQGNKWFKFEDVSELLRSMKKLEELRMCGTFVTDSGSVELFPGSGRKLSSLKFLIVDPITIQGQTLMKEGDSCPTFLEELITIAENISVLGILSMRDYGFRTGDDGDDDDGDEHIRSNGFRALTVIETLGREPFIRWLSLDGVRRPDVDLLRRMTAKPNGLKLKALSYSMDECEEESEHFHLVELFKDTLEDLQKFGSPCSNFINFPKMPKLTHLSLVISGNFYSSSINLNKIFPILKEMILRQHEIEDRPQVYVEFLPQSEPCLTMKSLSLLPGRRAGFHFRIDALNHILTTFPNLTELWLEVKVDGAEILREIWTRMTQLETLSIWGTLETMESTDSIFCGIPTEGIRRISDLLKGLDKLTIELQRQTILKLRNHHCRLPSVWSLTNLRRLELKVSGRVDYGRQPSYLSDVSGLLGFYPLKHLSRLVLRNCELTKMCCEKLTTKMEMGLESWEFSTPMGEAIIPDRTY